MNELYYQIDNTKLSEYLSWELINQEDITTIGDMLKTFTPDLYNLNNSNIQNEKQYYAILMYSMYNEIMSIVDIKNMILDKNPIFTELLANTEFVKKLNSKRVYKLIEFISTFTFDAYKNEQNIDNQLAIVYSSLDDTETTFLINNNLKMKDLIRISNSEKTRIEHAKIESAINIGIQNYTDILNDDINGSIFRSILLKIKKFKI